MSRPKKKAAPIADALPALRDVAELREWTADVAELWRDAGPATPPLSPQQIEVLAWDIGSCTAQQINPTAEKHDTAARAAITTLLAWCRYDRHDNGLPHVVIQDRRLRNLEAALLAAAPLAQAPPPRAWVVPMWRLWDTISHMMRANGGTARTSASSHTVRFIVSALQLAGHAKLERDAVSMELRRNVKFRERLSG